MSAYGIHFPAGINAEVRIMAYRVYVRTWWTENPTWPDGLEPCMGKKRTLVRRVETYTEALEIAQQYNRTHEPGRLGRKAEVEEL